jgi:DNA-binding transcriptional regulator LsrR (DeoR family)
MKTDGLDLNLITTIAKQYYYENKTQDEISRALNISRTKIGRMLKQSRELGLVVIKINLNPEELSELEQELKRRFGIQRALIALDYNDEDMQRSAIAQLVAEYLDDILTESSVVAVGMGRNVGAVPSHLENPKPRNCTFVSSIGGELRAGEGMNSDHICRRLAAAFKGRSETLYAPAYIKSLNLREMILEDETVRQTLNRARRADIALIGIGDCTENSYLVRMGWYTSFEIAQARMSGTVADVSGYDFLDIHGRPSAHELGRRVIGLSHDDFLRIPNVIAVASENNKTLSLLASLRSGIVNTIATSASNVRAILKIDDEGHNGTSRYR